MPIASQKPASTVRVPDINAWRRPAWDIAYLFPDQGQWSEDEYLDLDGGCLIEFTDGNIEVLPMPSPMHQRISFWLQMQLHQFVRSRELGDVVAAPMPVRIGSGKFREPDLAYLSSDHADWESDRCWNGADLVVEIVSESDPKRDLVKKRSEYARAGIAEYWIVQPTESVVTVLNLKGRSYQERRFKLGDMATSQRLAGFEVSISELFDSGKQPKPRRKVGKKS